MEIAVLVEAMDSRGFRATTILPRFVAEGDSPEEALDHLSKLVQDQLSRGELVRLQVPVPGNTRKRKSLAGIWKDHPDIDEVVRNIQEYRKQLDSDPDRI